MDKKEKGIFDYILLYVFKFVYGLIIKKPFLIIKLLFKWNKKIYILLIFPLVYLAHYMSLKSLNSDLDNTQIVVFCILLYFIFDVIIYFMKWKEIKEKIEITDEIIWIKENDLKIKKIENSLSEIFSINKLKIDNSNWNWYLVRTWKIKVLNFQKNEIEIKYILPNWLPFTKVDTAHIKQSAKQVFQKYFWNIEYISFTIKWDVFSIKSFWEKDTINFWDNIVFPGIKEKWLGLLKFKIWIYENSEESIFNLVKLPHLLVASETWWWKSVALNTILVSLMQNRLLWDNINFIIIDPKRVEFKDYKWLEGFTVETDIEKWMKLIEWVVQEMNNRYKILEKIRGVKNIEDYNKLGGNMWYIVLIIDEFWQIMSQWWDIEKNFENYIWQITQLARAVWIHVILSTQNPTSEVLTSNIKANMPSRLGLRTSDRVKSRTIIDSDVLSNIRYKWEWYIKTGSDGIKHLKIYYLSNLELDNFISYYESQIDYSIEKLNILDNIEIDKYENLLNKIIKEKTFKVNWYTELEWFSQIEMRKMSKKLQENDIVKKLPNNSLVLINDIAKKDLI